MSRRVDRSQPPVPPSLADSEADVGAGTAASPPNARSPDVAEGTTVPPGMLEVLRRVSARLLAQQQDGFELRSKPRAPNTPSSLLGWIPPRAKTPTSRELLSELASVRNTSISSTERDAILHLNVTQRRQFQAVLVALAEVKGGRLDSAGYFARCLQSAADLAGHDNALFVELVDLSFSQPSTGHKDVELGRELMDARPNPAGEVLERTFEAVIGAHNTPADGFNPAIVDSEDPKSTITHHFNAFLKAGFHRPRLVADGGVVLNDRPSKNPGDVRNGMFAVMIGRGLAQHELTPQTAAQLITWAMTREGEDGCSTPPWQSGPTSRGTAPEDYRLERWLRAYRGE